MAAVAELRNATDHDAQLYSIFHRGSNGPDGDVPFSDGSFGMDGTNEREQIEDRAQPETFVPQVMATPPTTPSTAQQLPVTQSTNISYGQIDGSSSQEFSPNDGRRKRRKISGEYHSHDNADITLEEQQCLPDQPQLKSAKIPNTSLSALPELVSQPGNVPQTPDSDRRRSPRSSTRKLSIEGDLLAEHVPITAQEKTEPYQTSPTRSKRTPKKKMLHLSSNGKLVNSPKKSPQEPEPRSEVQKTRRTNRHIQLKGGKFKPSLVVLLKYRSDEQGQSGIGQQIDQILTTPLSKPTKQQIQATKPAKSTHPFFLGKAVPRSSSTLSVVASVDSGKPTDLDHEGESNSDVKKSVPWKDLVFKSSKVGILKHPEAVPAIWPPLDIQHVGKALRPVNAGQHQAKTEAKLKQKKLDNTVTEDENFLIKFSTALRFRNPLREVLPPERLFLDAQSALRHIDDGSVPIDHRAVVTMRERALTHISAFDRAIAAGPSMWPQQLSPGTHEEVLQPMAAQLFEWLKHLAVHNVKQGVDNAPVKAQRKKHKPKRRDNELDDFIVDEDEDGMTSGVKKNVILITGPSGCGKTASVYAVAKQLGFEVFEIHPGMRRSTKDIFDKVGDMAQNHLVQRGESLSRSSSMPPADLVVNSSQERTGTQPTVANFFSAPKNQILVPKSRPETPQPSRKEQKQSLILFEEVDILFEDDRGFWAGVQSLVQQSKRPVILTCNDPSDIPFEALDLRSTLLYSPPPDNVAVEYLAYLAASEGHIIDRGALQRLYLSKRRDLRATMTELNFWCQMTVGSEKGGLDWFHTENHQADIDSAHRPRTFSRGTFHSGLDLCPQVFSDDEESLAYASSYLDVVPLSWNFSKMFLSSDGLTPDEAFIPRYCHLSSYESDMDLLDERLSTGIAATLLQTFEHRKFILDRDAICERFLSDRTQLESKTQTEFESFYPLMIEKPTFPPAQGRLAPSLDCYRSSIATDVAPYVRSIAAFDLRASQQKEAIFGPVAKKSRTTRAARAAAEGGTKATTRPEKWFPQDLDLRKVLESGRNLPIWVPDTEEIRSDITMSQTDTELSLQGDVSESSP